VRIETTFLNSRVGRRILRLFVLCALVPIALLAGISLWRVDYQLREQSRRELRQTSHEEGLAICERLTFLESDLRLVASSLQAGINIAPLTAEPTSDFGRHFKGIEIIDGSGVPKALLGKESWRLDLTNDELSHIRSGKGLVATRPCSDFRPCVFLAVAVNDKQPERGLVVGKMAPSYLFDAEDVAENKDICVLDENGATLMCSGKTPSAPRFKASKSVSGQFRWSREGRAYESDYWNVFLKPAFFADHWTVIASQARRDGLMPLAQFTRIFVPVILLSFLIVILLALIQIRREMVPLGKLREGTRRIANGAFDSRVEIKSGDEFEELADSFNGMADRIEKQFNTLQTNSDIDRAILSSWDIEQIVATLLAHLRTVLPYEAVCVSFLESDGSRRTRNYVSANGSERAPETMIRTISEKELRELGGQPKITTLRVGRLSPGFLVPLTSRGMRFFLYAPVIVRGKLAAMILLGHSKKSIWAEEDFAQARQIADRVGVALSNARLVGDLKLLYMGTLTALARAIDAKSHWTAGHSERVTNLALRIAEEMGLSGSDMDILRRGGLLHDIGKIGVSGQLLDKREKLTDQELAQIREHVEIGRRILEPIPGLAECMPVVMEHHEWFDGSGYPYGLAGEEISLHGRIFAVADCYDAIVSDRPYRSGLPASRALEILREGAGKQFDPRVVETFLRLVSNDPKLTIRQDYSESPVATR
jgi:putative nucleotidyltransferase with HDIG domain